MPKRRTSGPISAPEQEVRGLRRSRRASHSARGFTLIELLVVIAVTVLLSTYIISYQRTGQRQILLYVESQKIASLILKAKSLAIESFVDVSQGNCGYGLRVDYSGKSYGIFYYATSTTDNESKYIQCQEIKRSGSLAPGRIVPFSDTTQLNSELVFWTPPPGNATPPLYYVLFVPPDPETLLVDQSGDIVSGPGSEAVYLETKDGLASTTVVVNPAGQVNF